MCKGRKDSPNCTWSCSGCPDFECPKEDDYENGEDYYYDQCSQQHIDVSQRNRG